MKQSTVKGRSNTMKHHPTGDRPVTEQHKTQKVEEENHDEIYSDDDWPINEPGEKLYRITNTVYCKPQDEDKLEEELERQAVLLGGGEFMSRAS